MRLTPPATYDVEFETPTVDAQGQIIRRQACRATQFTEELDGGVTLEMVAVPGGMFSMGSPPHGGYEDERPQHPVSIRPFFLGRFLVTQRQWLEVMHNKLPCRFPNPDRPLERVSWKDARQFCKRLERLTGRPYRLPSEAEWEYACRAHTATPFHFGATITTDLANYVGEHLFAGEPKGIYRHGTTPPGSFPPNAFGLYDMHGNLWEWCADAWHEDYTGAPLDGSAWEAREAAHRVVRGGSWHETPNHCRSAVRLKFDPAEREDFIGFRVALTLPG
jgi:formylglycine-generating enzyme required for sulfatase activity